MNSRDEKQQLDHLLRAVGRITGEKQFLVIGANRCTEGAPTWPMTSSAPLKPTSLSRARPTAPSG
jgi:hypothetical protein